MIAAIYARKSTAQTGVSEEARSVTRQVEHARAYALTKGWTVSEAHIYVDDGISGAEFERRPGFLRLMNALKPRPPFQILILSEDSRLGREQIETAYALKQLISAGVRVFYYLEDRERTLDSPTDKLMLSVATYADELERDRARQRTRDALLRKARAGAVTGGRVFGYDNVEVLADSPEADGRRRRLSVTRVSNEAEAAVVRRIFARYARGAGFREIAHALNADRLPAPRPRAGRPRGWAPSTVRDVLYRDLYRGLAIWNRTQKRDAWGRKRRSRRPKDDWIQVDLPDLRVVSEELWGAAHDRLRGARAVYLRDTGGKLWGKPANGIESRYLLTGMALCGLCHGALTIRSRSHGQHRAYFYQCLTNVQRGRAVCGNALAVPMDAADEAVLGIVERTVLRPEVVTAAIRDAVTRLGPPAEEQTTARERVRSELGRVEAELARLAETVAREGGLPSLVEAIRDRERQRDRLQQDLVAVDQLAQISQIDLPALERALRAKLEDWRALLTRHVQPARQILRQLLDGRLRFTPREDGERKYYLFEGTGRLEPVLAGEILSKALVAPTGFEPVFQPRPRSRQYSRAVRCCEPRRTQVRLKRAGSSSVGPGRRPPVPARADQRGLRRQDTGHITRTAILPS